MTTHPLWRPYETVDLAEADQVRVAGEATWAIEVVAYDERWPEQYAALEASIRGALGERVLALSHVGSTAVPGLAAKPVLDVDLTVADTDDEAAYVPPLEALGFYLRIREPEWEGHRLLARPDHTVNLHVFPPTAVEPARHLAFRDWLRTHADDRAAYAAHKVELAERGFERGMDYNNHKAALVYDIYERVFTADPDHPHEGRPR